MNNLKLLVITLLFGTSTFAQGLPSAQQVVDNYIKARGGSEAIAAIQDMTISLASSSDRGFAETELIYQFPNFKTSMSVFSNGREVMSSKYDGNKFKRESPFGGSSEPKEGDEAKMEGMMMHPFAELAYEKMGVTASVEGIEKVNDKDAYVVKLSIGDRTWTDYFDVASGLKVKTVIKNTSPRGSFESTSTYDAYEKFKGSEVLFPKIRKQSSVSGRGTMETSSEVSSIKFNKGIKDKVFQVN